MQMQQPSRRVIAVPLVLPEPEDEHAPDRPGAADDARADVPEPARPPAPATSP
jgi:hypothetical protein